MAVGAFLRGNPLRPTRDELEDPLREKKRYPAILWGVLTGDAEVSMDKGRPKVAFLVKFGPSVDVNDKHKEGTGYRKCEAYGDTAVTTVMALCEKGETVVCFGEWRMVKYKGDVLNRKGRKKRDYHLFRVDAVYPMNFLWFIAKLYACPEIRELVEKADAPDAFESAEDDIGF